MQKIHTIKDLQKILKLSERTVFNYLKSGKLTGSKPHGKWLFTEKDIKKFLNKGRKNNK